ncbi:MAG: hypothetical protein ACKV22_01015 [Bryobacteraceae bacterium]
MATRYIPPRNSDPEVSYELRILFFEAVARVTEAFRELRDEVLPSFLESPTTAHPTFEAWLRRWHLGQIEWAPVWFWNNVLPTWLQTPGEAERLDVTCGWWERPTSPPVPWLFAGAAPTLIAWTHWDPEAESFDSYREKKLAAVEALLAREREINETEMAHYGERLITKRQRDGRAPEHDFEWLALRLCKGMNVVAIAAKYDVAPERVRKSTERLAAALDITESLTRQ